MSKLLAAIVVVMFAAISLTACSSTSTAHGTVSGKLIEAGGPAPGLFVGVPGQIRLTATSGALFTTSANANGYYTITVPPGTYTITGGSPKAQVQQGNKFIDMVGYARHRVTVTTGAAMTNVNVFIAIS